MELIRGVDERVAPDVKLTRSRDGSNGKAIFRFEGRAGSWGFE